MTTGLFRPLSGNSIIKTLSDLVTKLALLNIRNDGNNNCFEYSILAALHPFNHNPANPHLYNKFFPELNMAGIETPIAISSIPKFESQNVSISVNVMVRDEKDFVPIYTSKFCNQRPNHVNLLLLSQGDKRHYVLIKIFVDSLHIGRITMVKLSSVRIAVIHSQNKAVSTITVPHAVNIPLKPRDIPK